MQGGGISAECSVEQKGAKTGTVKWFNEEKGYGFIIPDDGGPDLFVHNGVILGNGSHKPYVLYEGQRVQFEETKGVYGPKNAINVNRLM